MIIEQTKEVKQLLTKSSLPDADYVINPYIGCPHKCIYCYAEFMKRFTSHKGEVWGDFIDVKIPAKPVSLKGLTGTKSVLISSVTDPYNGFENRYRVTRKVLEQLEGCEAHIDILTKSSLVVRDIDVLKKIKNIRVGISLNTLDDTFRKKIEVRAASIGKRLEALRTLNEQGIKTFLFMSPMFPGLTGFEKIFEETCGYVSRYYFENLNLRAGYKKRVLDIISEFYPDLTGLYQEIYSTKKHQYWQNLEQKIHSFFSDKKAEYGIYFYHSEIKKS